MVSVADFYQVLDLGDKRNGREITAAELKQAYKRALLIHHPDKQPSSLASPGALEATVDVITQAFKTLADPILRAEYDRDQRLRAEDADEPSVKRETRHTGMETVDLEDLDFEESSEAWTKPCRCGSEPAYMVTETELEKNVEYGELIIGCKGCSLWLKVLFSADD
ncbi:related to Caj1p [Ramularia collo-cygni]|uniref:Diphthamide biosynthesis protein 4 n=1 Tax=Ramularia collo-cygni TaxID=112498 RepID=A0A2D3UP56_9PEZI|nr:related to Caj1p [Ramularia collo-cygni]CZT18172.1 related to Caj1p [Ramularia collo-cygni]